MRTIWKFDVPIRDVVTLRMPSGAKVLTVQMQGHKPCLWAEVLPDESAVERKFIWLGTGHQVPESAETYIGTVQQECYVWHLYEATP